MYAEYSKIIKFDTLPDPTDTWELVDKIGEGTYGEVHSARNKHTGRIPLASVHVCVCMCVYVCVCTCLYMCMLVYGDFCK